MTARYVRRGVKESMRTYKAAVIGCGTIFPTHGVSIKLCELAALTAVCDIIPERAKKTAEEYSCAAYTDWREMLEREELDAVHICLPHHLHAPVAVECMKKGLHVICEKPLATSFEDARLMADTAKECGVKLSCIFQNRYNAGVQLVRNLFLSGELGRVKGAKCFVTWRRVGKYYSESEWRGRWETEGGGVIINQAIHTLDAMKYIMAAHPVEVDAVIANRGGEPIEVEDTAEGAILFDNGVLANFHAISYYSFDDEVQIDFDFENGRAKIISDRADVVMKDGRVIKARRDEKETADYGDTKSYWGVNHSKQINDFYECLKNGNESLLHLEESVETLKMVCAIYESGKSGKKVKI